MGPVGTFTELALAQVKAAKGAVHKPVSSVTEAIDDVLTGVATRAIMVRGAIDNAAGLVRPGMLMRVTLQQEAVQTLVIPELAVQQIGNRTFVYLAGADGTAQSRDVRIGSRHDGKAEVLEGLKSGEKVVLEGTSKLRDGQKLKVVPAVP